MSEYSVKVIVATHKEYRMPSDSIYLPVQVGAVGKKSMGYQRDDEGDNISEINPYFCELTGMYWGWKNLDSDYIGLAHYRRHFGKKKGNDIWDRILKYDDIKDELGKIKVFVPAKRFYIIETLYSHYKHTHHIEQLDEAKKIIRGKYPQYINSFEKICNRKWGYMFNMLIMEKDLFGSYCTWVFDILFELKNRMGEDGLTPFQSRYYGRISEIIFNVWLDKQIDMGIIGENEIREVPLIYVEKVDWWKKGLAFLAAKFFGKKYYKSY